MLDLIKYNGSNCTSKRVTKTLKKRMRGGHKKVPKISTCFHTPASVIDCKSKYSP